MKRDLQDNRFREWIRQYQGIFVHIANGFAPPDERDDLLQEMLLATWHSVPHFRGDSSPATFLYRVAQNTALTWYRRRARMPFVEELDESLHAAPPASMKFERSELLYQAIQQLPELDRALVLMYLDELSYRDISEVTGISESNVGVRLNRVRARLAKLVEES